MMLEVRMVVTSGESVKTGKEYKRALSGVQGNLFLDLGAGKKIYGYFVKIYQAIYL